MKKIITVSAPGKLMLFGEHAVVYGKPCIVTAVNQRMFVMAEQTTTNELLFDAKDVGIKNYKKRIDALGKGQIPKAAQFVEIAIKNFFLCHPEFISGSHMLGLKISTTSEFSSTYGFGSSSAVTVCIIKALTELFEIKLSKKDIFDIAYKTVLDIQKIGSGVDIAAAVYGGTLYFVSGGKMIESLNIKPLPLVVGYSGSKADTVTLLNGVKEKAKKYPEIITGIYTDIEKIVILAKKALIKNDLQTVGELMNFNQGYLESLGVSTDRLSNMIYAARNIGAYGAKLSGAGGGDCMIAIADKKHEEKVKQGIEQNGGQIIQIQTHAEGVRREL
ncbi:MAG: mevalonate kinase [Candidatus Levybacteria bacterium]|nr:mevalonate kinase [Candidatus Levybacteria bacterium]